MTPLATPSSRWLASVLEILLNLRYADNIPSLRAISQDMQETVGSTLSHGQIRNILQGNGINVTDRTRKTLADFFEVPLSTFYPPDHLGEEEFSILSHLFTKILAFNLAQLKAIAKAVDAVAKN